MIEVPATGKEPRIHIYESLQELENATGMKRVHGYYDPQENVIIATFDTVAHEVGHYLDFKHGGLKMISQIEDPLERSQAKMRNEIVAILYARKKLGTEGSFMRHEKDFIDWFSFMRKSRKPFGPHADVAFEKMSVSQLQQIGDWVVLLDHEWFKKLEFIFRGYLQDEHVTLTYRY